MKNAITIMILAALLPVPFAVATSTFPAGTREVLFEGSFTLENHKGSTRADILAGYGYFPMDNIEVGAVASFRKTEWDSAWGINSIWGIGGFGEYNIETGGAWLPFAGMRLMVLDGNDSNDTAINATVMLGVKLMMTRSAALSIGAYYDIASKKIYIIDGKPDDTNLTGKAGFRVFF